MTTGNGIVILTEEERLVIAALQNRAELSLKEQSTLVGIPEHRLRRIFERLRSRQILLGRSPLINPFRLARLGGALYFATRALSQKKRDSLNEALCSLDSALYSARTGGEYDYLISFMLTSYENLYDMLMTIGREHGDIFSKKMVVMTTRLNSYSRKHLLPTAASLPTLHYALDDKPVAIDELDEQILRSLSDLEFHSHRKIAESLGIHHTMVERRVARLKKNGVILGMIYRFDLSAAGFSSYRLLVSLHGMRPDTHVRFRKYAARHPNIVRCIETIGAWDFELDIEVSSAHAISEVIQDIQSSFEKELSQIQTLQLFRHLFFRGVPVFSPQALRIQDDKDVA